MQQVNWFSREFDFSQDQNIFPSLVERLTGTPIRLEEKLKGLPEERLNEKPGGTWSIKENVGHLTDLEILWQGRLEDIRMGRPEMRPTDLQNTRTTTANHNAKSIEELLTEFREIRKQTVELLEQVDEELVFRSSLHPRLNTPMRTMDLFLFVAEHDDHHLARISGLMKILSAISSKTNL